MRHLLHHHLFLPRTHSRRTLASNLHLPLATGFGRYLAAIRRATFNTRRCLAMSGILLAFSIEFCGCDSVRDCALVRHTQIYSLPWTELLQQCSQCLSASEVILLERRRQTEEERSSGLGLPSSFASDRTVEQALRGEMEPTFDNAAAPTAEGSYPPLLLARGRLTATASPPRETRTIPWAIPESVFFVYKHLPGQSDPSQRPPAATAFVVSVPAPRAAPATRAGFVRFLVTARHVVDPAWANCAEPEPASIDVRFNRRSGGVGYETIALEANGLRRFFTPSDPAADLAIIPLDQAIGPRLDEYKFLDTPFRMIPTGPETQLFHPGLPVMTARLSPGPSDDPDSYPVFDAGTLATMPAASIDVQCDRQSEARGDRKPLHVWFIDGGIPRGVSGAPVYTALARGTNAAAGPVLLGIQSVTWPDKGIAGITPSSVLADLIRSALRENNVGAGPHRGFRPRQAESLASLY